MTVLRKYNTSTSQWEPIVSGATGPTGPTGPTGAASSVPGPTGPEASPDSENIIIGFRVFS